MSVAEAVQATAGLTAKDAPFFVSLVERMNALGGPQRRRIVAALARVFK